MPALDANVRVPLPTTPSSTVILHMFERELDAATATRESLLARSVAVISTSGALVAVFLGAAGLVAGATAAQLPAGVARFPIQTLVMMVTATAAFLGSGLIAVVMMWPRRSLGYTRETLEEYADPRITLLASSYTEEKLSEALSKRVTAARITNRRLAWTLMAALSLEALGVVVAAYAVYTIIATAFG